MSSKGEPKERVTEDPRFTGIHNDPKFRSTKSKNFKIKLDDRFSKEDLEVRRKAKVDKYGRKIEAENKDVKDFDRYFTKEKKDDEEEASSSENASEGEETTVHAKSFDRARGETPADYVSSSDENSSSESEEESGDSDVESEEEEPEESKPASGDATKTLAVVNLDWDHVKSTDLFVTFKSFVPPGGEIERVCVYPSEFGKERMQREDIEGPPKELFQTKKSKKTDGDDNNLDIKSIYEEGDADKDYDSRSLRRYQLERLRYFYAVVYCSDVRTAESIYQNCDGTEYESTANVFDLRYVPDGMEMDDKPRDECTSLPKNYKPAQFSTDALQHSKVKLTWDETPADRVEISKRAFTQREVEEMDFKAYLASDSEESEDEQNDQSKNRLKALVMDSVKVGEKSLFNEKDGEEDNEVDMEITFTPGLDENTQPETNDNEEESTIDKLRRKEKERRKKRKDRVKELKKESESKLKKTSTKRREDSKSPDDDKKKAELELLMLDENEENSTINNKAHFNMKEIIKSEKEKAKKSKYRNKEKIVEDQFTPDTSDPRFKEVFEDHDFAIDPTQPEFKKTPAMEKILNERVKRSNKKSHGKKRNNDISDAQNGDSTTKINGLVEKLKAKSKRVKR
ncbi:unnamed protein product [Kluyveromyces dobzhanskii CBS 2104]|uniref:WGS project CCBQ000000000 data, contig 00011 n=1 Tax=Kluyveromyces dobzhanskii CBS 2104 TaxID=1427455 RepID=A0A0A8L812_9SACH|nr:unnamed protein product [Kluyveromyces dobzhanskii CBS 2104]